MSDVQIFEGVHMRTSGNTDMPPNSFDIQQVILWDVGPPKPLAPKRPVVPKVMKESKEGDPEYDLAKIEMADLLEEYAEALKRWKQAKIDYADWHGRNDGPVEIPFWSCDAADALARDAAAVKEGRQLELRYYLSSRTRGHANRPNRGLPEGKRPGKGQAELERREREGDADLVAARAADPIFGKQEIRQ
jgi:hypothetical protein